MTDGGSFLVDKASTFGKLLLTFGFCKVKVKKIEPLAPFVENGKGRCLPIYQLYRFEKQKALAFFIWGAKVFP